MGKPKGKKTEKEKSKKKDNKISNKKGKKKEEKKKPKVSKKTEKKKDKKDTKLNKNKAKEKVKKNNKTSKNKEKEKGKKKDTKAGKNKEKGKGKKKDATTGKNKNKKKEQSTKKEAKGVKTKQKKNDKGGINVIINIKGNSKSKIKNETKTEDNGGKGNKEEDVKEISTINKISAMEISATDHENAKLSEESVKIELPNEDDDDDEANANANADADTDADADAVYDDKAESTSSYETENEKNMAKIAFVINVIFIIAAMALFALIPACEKEPESDVIMQTEGVMGNTSSFDQLSSVSMTAATVSLLNSSTTPSLNTTNNTQPKSTTSLFTNTTTILPPTTTTTLSSTMSTNTTTETTTRPATTTTSTTATTTTLSLTATTTQPTTTSTTQPTTTSTTQPTTSSTTTTTTTRPTTTTTAQPRNTTTSRQTTTMGKIYQYPVKQDCGISLFPPKDETSWPWFVRMYKVRFLEKVYEYMCDATIIGPSHVLTVQDCIANMPRKVIESEYYAGFGAIDGGHKYISVKNFDVHPKFQPTFGYNFVLFRLEIQFPMEQRTYPVCLPSNNQKEMESTAHCRTLVWRDWKLGTKIGIYSEVTATKNCPQSALLGNEDQEMVTCVDGILNKAICATGRGASFVCQEHNRWYLHGVVTKRPDCVGDKTVTYSVSTVMDWLCCFISQEKSCIGVQCRYKLSP